MKKTPFQQVTERHGGKDKLVAKVEALIQKVTGLGDETKDDLKKRLQSVANSQLMQLEHVLGEIEGRWETKEKLVDAYLGLLNRQKDVDYRRSLLTNPPAQLLDRYRSAEKRINRAKRAAA